MVLPVCRAPCIQLCHYACAELGNIVNELQGERIFWLCQFCVDASERAATAAGVPIYEGVVSAASESQSRGAKCVTNTVAGSVCVLRTELNAAVVFRVPCPVSRVPCPYAGSQAVCCVPKDLYWNADVVYSVLHLQGRECGWWLLHAVWGCCVSSCGVFVRTRVCRLVYPDTPWLLCVRACTSGCTTSAPGSRTLQKRSSMTL